MDFKWIMIMSVVSSVCVTVILVVSMLVSGEGLSGN